MSEAVELEREFPAIGRKYFAIPTFDSTGIRKGDTSEVTYLCGNSLGLMPLGTRDRMRDELNTWAAEGVMGHHIRFDGRDPWIENDVSVSKRLAEQIMGCNASEVVLAGSLTSNLNGLLHAFYKPTADRYKIICESRSFPSDDYCFQNQVKLNGFSEDAVVAIEPREGEMVLRTEDIIDTIKKHGKETAIVCLSGVQFYTGQCFDIAAITKATHDVGAISGWDLAHAAGNIELKLHEWNVDFAVFCSYKYLNCGAGNTAGFFVHDDFAEKYISKPRPAGWWGVDLSTRFDMEHEFVPAKGARGFLQSNCSFAGPPCMHASLDVFEACGGLKALIKRQKVLTAYTTRQLKVSKHYGKSFHILTDILSEEESGAQISLFFNIDLDKVADGLESAGIICDARKNNVVRITTAPLYNTFEDSEVFINTLEKVLDSLN